MKSHNEEYNPNQYPVIFKHLPETRNFKDRTPVSRSTLELQDIFLNLKWSDIEIRVIRALNRIFSLFSTDLGGIRRIFALLQILQCSEIALFYILCSKQIQIRVRWVPLTSINRHIFCFIFLQILHLGCVFSHQKRVCCLGTITLWRNESGTKIYIDTLIFIEGEFIIILLFQFYQWE